MLVQRDTRGRHLWLLQRIPDAHQQSQLQQPYVNIHTQGVTIHKEVDNLTMYNGKSILIGVRDNGDKYRIPLLQ